MLAYVLTLSRVPLAAAFALLTWAAHRAGAGALSGACAGGLLALAGAIELTDLLDGPAARRGGGGTRLGGLADPLCDSLSRLTVFFSLALADLLPLAVPLVMAGRDLLVAYARIVSACVGTSTSARLSGKIKAIVQGLAVGAALVLAAWAPPGTRGPGRALVAALVIAVTAWSAVDYVYACRKGIVQLFRADRPGR